jgi:hypothetical protein
LADAHFLLLEPSPVYPVHEAQASEHDPVILGEQFDLGLNGLQLKNSLFRSISPNVPSLLAFATFFLDNNPFYYPLTIYLWDLA